MKRIHVLVEGQTEETFVRNVLGPHLLVRHINVHVAILSTKRIKAGGKFRGGITSYSQVRREVRNLLADTGVAAVTTMIDYYGLPDDFPGKTGLSQGGSCYQRAVYLEEAFKTEISHRLFFPYLSLHEFEALLLVRPEEIGRALPGQPLMNRLAEETAGFRSPEEVNDGPETHPAARIRQAAPSYQKRLHGPIIASRIGLDAIRSNCPHFAGWLERLEGLAGSGPSS